MGNLLSAKMMVIKAAKDISVKKTLLTAGMITRTSIAVNMWRNLKVLG